MFKSYTFAFSFPEPRSGPGYSDLRTENRWIRTAHAQKRKHSKLNNRIHRIWNRFSFSVLVLLFGSYAHPKKVLHPSQNVCSLWFFQSNIDFKYFFFILYIIWWKLYQMKMHFKHYPFMYFTSSIIKYNKIYLKSKFE